MKTERERVTPAEIEKRSFEIIESELPHPIDPSLAPIIKRVVHTSADFDYVDNLCFSEGVVQKALRAIENGACIVTDTNMAKAGINKASLAKHGAGILISVIQPVRPDMLKGSFSSFCGIISVNRQD